jgi:ubiquinone/menaquinone biosynthesis C-methylase UbiE
LRDNLSSLLSPEAAMMLTKYLTNRKLLPPTPIVELLHTSWAVQILKSSLDLGVFEALRDGPLPSQDVASKLGLDSRGAAFLLDSLVGMEVLGRAELMGKELKGRPVYELNILSRTYLVKESPLFMGLYFRQHEELDKMWRRLKDSLLSGKPVMAVNEDKQAEEIFPQLAEAIVPWNYVIAGDVVESLKERGNSLGRVLDLACGSAIWSIPFAQGAQAVEWCEAIERGDTCGGNGAEGAVATENTGAGTEGCAAVGVGPDEKAQVAGLGAGAAEGVSPVHVDALDFPAVLQVARKTTARFKVAERYSYLEGSWRDVKLADHSYDVIILGHILHSEGMAASQALLAYCYSAMKAGAALVIGEFMPNKERTGPLFPLMFALNMYLATSDGCVFSFEELREMCLEAGFSEVFRHSAVEYDSPVVVAIK